MSGNRQAVARLALGLLLLVPSALLAAAGPSAAGSVAAVVGRGSFVPLANGQGERFSLGPALADRLLAVPLGDTLAVEEFPIALGQRRAILFERIDVYAPDAKILRADRHGYTELP